MLDSLQAPSGLVDAYFTIYPRSVKAFSPCRPQRDAQVIRDYLVLISLSNLPSATH